MVIVPGGDGSLSGSVINDENDASRATSLSLEGCEDSLLPTSRSDPPGFCQAEPFGNSFGHGGRLPWCLSQFPLSCPAEARQGSRSFGEGPAAPWYTRASSPTQNISSPSREKQCEHLTMHWSVSLRPRGIRSQEIRSRLYL